ncbi:MAG: hypothetical protein ISQ32_01000 [Rickettsiales bacterium]|nr:hypothetical protein [Rickettsiales bacterium]
MKDRSLKALKFTVIFMNFVLIAGFVLFVIIAVKFVTKSKCKNFDYYVDDIDNVKLSFSDKKIYIIQNTNNEIYLEVLDHCNGSKINHLKLKEHE